MSILPVFLSSISRVNSPAVYNAAPNILGYWTYPYAVGISQKSWLYVVYPWREIALRTSLSAVDDITVPPITTELSTSPLKFIFSGEVKYAPQSSRKITKSSLISSHTVVFSGGGFFIVNVESANVFFCEL